MNLKEKTMNQTFGQIVHSLRLKKGFTSARKASTALDISNVYLHEIEGDLKIPSNEVILKMADVYNVDPIYLVSLASKSKTKTPSAARLEVARYIMSMSDDEFDDFQVTLAKQKGGDC